MDSVQAHPLQFILLDLFLETALLQQFVSLIQDKEPNAGCRQHPQLYQLLDTAC